MAQLTIVNMKFPDPDSHYRLCPCSCRNENPAYVQILSGNTKHWLVRCFTCGKTGKPFPVRHDAQVYWNNNMAVMPKRKVESNV